MPDQEEKLLAYNNEGIMGNLLSAEEHLSEPADINNTWCVKKHLTLASQHHAKEAINHASAINPKLANKYKQFKEKLDDARQEPTLARLRNLRNEFREISGDPTLKNCNGVCDLDKLKPSHLNNWSNNNLLSQTEKSELSQDIQDNLDAFDLSSNENTEGDIMVTKASIMGAATVAAAPAAGALVSGWTAPTLANLARDNNLPTFGVSSDSFYNLLAGTAVVVAAQYFLRSATGTNAMLRNGLTGLGLGHIAIGASYLFNVQRSASLGGRSVPQTRSAPLGNGVPAQPSALVQVKR